MKRTFKTLCMLIAVFSLPAEALTEKDFLGDWTDPDDNFISIETKDDGGLSIAVSEPVKGTDDFNACECSGRYDPDRLRLYPAPKSSCSVFRFKIGEDLTEKESYEKDNNFYLIINDSMKLEKIEQDCKKGTACRSVFTKDDE